MDVRVGLGRDVHRLVPGDRLILGGVGIEFELRAEGHSDADVLLHALTDALLGAAGLGDIGEWFPDTDARWSGADSAALLGEVVSAVHTRGWKIGNLDCTILAERPKLSPYKAEIRQRLAELLSVEIEAVNVKAKTGEAVGPIGRGEAIGAEAAVLLMRDE